MMRLLIAMAALGGGLLAADPTLEMELALPPVALGPGLKLDASAGPKYDDRPGDGEFRRAVRQGQVLLWATIEAAPPRPLRDEVLKAKSKLGVRPGTLRTRIEAPKNMPMTIALKSGLMDVSRAVARLSAALESQLDTLERLSETRDKETPRWQAHGDLVSAALMLRIAHLDEYAILLGDMRKEFPERDAAKHKGWRLVPAEGLRDVPGKRRVKAAKKLLERLAADHPDTPWASAARQLMETPLSAEWKAE